MQLFHFRKVTTRPPSYLLFIGYACVEGLKDVEHLGFVEITGARDVEEVKGVVHHVTLVLACEWERRGGRVQTSWAGYLIPLERRVRWVLGSFGLT